MKKTSHLERVVVKSLNNLGLTFETQRDDLPGTPDIVFEQEKVVVFVHGCYWHNHNCINKTNGNRLQQERDLYVTKKLKELGYSVEILWECDLRKSFNSKIEHVVKIIQSRKKHGP